ncbi:MAG: GNAT family N-acetyltransferase [Acidimicrobiia bacterium]
MAERITGGRTARTRRTAERSDAGRPPQSFGWAKARPWRGDRTTAHLVLSDRVPREPSTVESCLGPLRRSGYRSVVTTAMQPGDALAFVDAGFDVRERLHLLEHDLERIPNPTTSPRRLRRARRGDRESVLGLDGLAFDDFWRLDEQGLRDALQATPSVRFRIGESADGQLAAYSIIGRAGRQGYLQRVAVHPAARRQGWGVMLVVDALRWLVRHDVRRALVNTQWTNDGALALYEACGFRRLPAGLCVLDRAL